MKYRLYAKDGLYLIVEDEPGGQVAGAFYALLEQPGYWWGHALGREQKLHMPDADPRDVAVALMQPTPARDAVIQLAAPTGQLPAS